MSDGKKNTNMKDKDFVIEVAHEVLKQFKEEEEKAETKTVFRNTRVLMSHYNELKAHCKGYMDDLCNDETYKYGQLNYDKVIQELSEDVIIESILRTRARTYVMVKYIDTCLEVLQESMKNANIYEKYQVFKIFYLDIETCKLQRSEKKSIAATELIISERTAERYELDMIHEMSVLLFGIGASKLIK